MNDLLMVDISENEIKGVVFQMHPTKAPAHMECLFSFSNSFGKVWAQMSLWSSKISLCLVIYSGRLISHM